MVLAALLLAPLRTDAADLPGTTHYETTTESGLTFNIVPFYLWLPGLNGTVGVFGVNAAIDVTPIDILKDLGDFLDVLEGLYMGTGEVRYDQFGFFYDVYYIDVASSNEIDVAFVRGNLDVGFSQVMATMAGSYRFYETDAGYVDALAGLRIWHVDLQVGVNLNIAATTASSGDTWVDPLIGGKGRYNLTDNWYLSGWAMIGGFGAGSEFMWDVWANAGYEVNGWLDVFLGFRSAGADYQDESFIWDIHQYGPVLGATIKLN